MLKSIWILLSDKATPIWCNDGKMPLNIFKIHSKKKKKSRKRHVAELPITRVPSFNFIYSKGNLGKYLPSSVHHIYLCIF